ncbi:NAD-dependent epimerase/dehydratase family protein [Terrilactibacillus sp. BCM23-1]|uniref:GDP-L-fucose synthase n=1 Tax=Terrilactibacillus tamarindi TaxID=2599694 RepID=A0A6N8CM17_9BACI|nr:GDP-L-fucose synthase [Terrilactibacillus tamarindi]MTT30901.1 NAD-dependent epimerase/dehydratase family protein [Terrilactibacillus tamarindi]
MDIKSKRIVVTGGAGFLGKHVVKRLKDEGCKFIFVPRSKDFNLTKEAEIIRMLHTFDPDIVIHLAAVVGGIGANQKNPGKFFYENLIMGAQLMELSRVYGVEKFVAIGTICSYPKFTPVPFLEENLWEGYPEETNAPYGLAKKMMLVQSQAYRDQYGFNSIFLLPVNLYGPGDNFDLETSHVIPAMIRKFVEAKQNGESKVTLWGSGQATREFLYVEDAADSIVLATKYYNQSDPINIGSGHDTSIKKLAETIQVLTGFEGDVVWDTSKPDGQPKRRLDVQKAKEAFGFTAKTNLLVGLQKTLKWYLDETKIDLNK